MNPVSDLPAAGRVHRTSQGDVACLCFDNPPVNALSSAVRHALLRALETAEQDDAVVAVVIHAAGRMFSGGGDLREVGQPAGDEPSSMGALALRIERGPKPVVAALQGKAIGGGVLLSMGCHARIASHDATILLPEVNLGFTPGAGGTQRLARLVGVERALHMVALARPLDALSAHKAGFFDEVVPSDGHLLDAAVRRARAIAHGELPWRRTHTLSAQAPEAQSLDALAARYRALAEAAFPGREAGPAAVDLVLDAVRLDFDAGMQRERETYQRLSNAPQARALIAELLAQRSRRQA